MTIDYIRIDVDILRQSSLSDKAKMLLGLIHGFNSKGLMMSNAELAKLLCCSPDYVGKLLKEIWQYITIQHPQSRYRKIFYSVGNNGVDTGLLRTEERSKNNSTPSYRPATQHHRTATPSKSADIIKETENKGSPKRTFPLDSAEIRLAQLLLDLILRRKPDYKRPDIQLWAKQVDLIIRVDKRPLDRIEAVIRWCQNDAGNGNGWAGWQNNILSPAKLREKFDKLEFAMEKKDGNTAIQRRFATDPNALAI